MGSPTVTFDVTEVASLRERLAHAATALKVIGFLSFPLAGFSLNRLTGSLGAAEIIMALLLPGCAFLIAKRLRRGRAWAVALAAIWALLFALGVRYILFPDLLQLGMDAYGKIGLAMYCVSLYFVVRGLYGYIAHRLTLINGKCLKNTLALISYADDLDHKKYPKFLRLNNAAYILLILSPLPYLAIRISQPYELFEDEAQFFGSLIGSGIIAFTMIFWGTWIYRRARRNAMLPGSALMKNDARPLVLYLRSFQDDSKIKMRARTANGRILPERLHKISFEEVVTEHMWGYGPVLAIGDPRTKSELAPLGAAREYEDDLSWQQKVTDLVRDAAMVIAVAGGTEGLVWEIDAIAKQGSLWKLVLLLPPVGAQELQARWQGLSSHGIRNMLPADMDFTRSRAVIFPQGRPTLITAKASNDWTYEAVLDVAVLAIGSGRENAFIPLQNSQLQSHTANVSAIFQAVMSDLGSVMAATSLVLLMLAAVAGESYYKSIAHLPNGYFRQKLFDGYMKSCRDQNKSQLSVEQLESYCSCFGNRLTDSLTLADVEEPKLGELHKKQSSIAADCSKETLGR